MNRKVAKHAKELVFSFVAEAATNENQHASGSRIYRGPLPEGLGLISFRLSQRKGIKKSILSDLGDLGDLGVLNDHAMAWEWAVR